MFKFLMIMYFLTLADGFFIDGGDIRKFFGIPSFFEVYKKEGSENYELENSDVEEEDDYQHRYKDKEEAENPSNLEIIYPRKVKTSKRYKPSNYEDKEYSNRDEQVAYRKYRTKYNANTGGDPHCDYSGSRKTKHDAADNSDRVRESRRNSNEELREKIEDERRVAISKLKKKDYVTGILVALPRFSDGAEKNHEFYIIKDNMKQYFKTVEKESKNLQDE